MSLNTTESTQLMNETVINCPDTAGTSSGSNVALVNVQFSGFFLNKSPLTVFNENNTFSF